MQLQFDVVVLVFLLLFVICIWWGCLFGGGMICFDFIVNFDDFLMYIQGIGVNVVDVNDLVVYFVSQDIVQVLIFEGVIVDWYFVFLCFIGQVGFVWFFNFIGQFGVLVSWVVGVYFQRFFVNGFYEFVNVSFSCGFSFFVLSYYDIIFVSVDVFDVS